MRSNYYQDDYENDYYDGYEDDLNYKKPSIYDFIDEDAANRKKRKKKSILLSVGVTTVAALSLSGIGIGVYFWVKDNFISKPYVGGFDSETSLYMAQRTLSLQFVLSLPKNPGYYSTISGTGWIINKDLNNDIYYIATNLHVAAALTYENKTVGELETDENGNSKIDYTSFGNIIQSVVGYLPGTVGIHTQGLTDDLNMITVPTPTIEYITDYDSQWNYGTVGSGNAIYPLASDFAILKYDFSDSNLKSKTILHNANGTVRSENPNTNSDVSNFQNWLKYYDKNPTKFITEPLQNIKSNESSNWYVNSAKYSMGGFPATQVESSGIPIYENKNFGSTRWMAYIDFGAKQYTNSNLGDATSVKTHYEAKNAQPIVYVKDKSISAYTEYYDGYINGAYGLRLDQYSAGGSSGSMLMTYIDDQPYVVGIYWGRTSNQLANQSSGAADILYTNNNGKEAGYNIFGSSYEYLLNNGANLKVNQKTNEIYEVPSDSTK